MLNISSLETLNVSEQDIDYMIWLYNNLKGICVVIGGVNSYLMSYVILSNPRVDCLVILPDIGVPSIDISMASVIFIDKGANYRYLPQILTMIIGKPPYHPILLCGLDYDEPSTRATLASMNLGVNKGIGSLWYLYF